MKFYVCGKIGKKNPSPEILAKFKKAEDMLGEPFEQSFDRQIHGPIYEVRANDDLRVNCGMTAVLDAYMSCIIHFD